MNDAIRTYGENQRPEATSFINTNRSSMLSAIIRSKICLIGDFHTYGPCQRFFAHTLEAIEELDPGSSFCILEFLSEDDEKYVREFLDSKISLETFLDKTQLQLKWPFPLTEYARVLELCRKHKIAVFGMRTSEGSTLYQDDLYFSSRIQDLLTRHPTYRAMVLVGEKHLSQNTELIVSAEGIEKNHTVSVFVDRYFSSANTNANNPPNPRFFHNETESVFIANRHPEWKKWLSVMFWERWVEGEGRRPKKGFSLDEIDTSEIDSFLFNQAKAFISKTLEHDQSSGDGASRMDFAIQDLPIEGLPVAELAKSAFSKAFIASDLAKEAGIKHLQDAFLRQLFY